MRLTRENLVFVFLRVAHWLLRHSANALSARSLSVNGHHNCPAPRFNVTFDVEYLLPGAEDRLAILHRNRERWPKSRCLQVGVAVAIMPHLLVSVVVPGGNQPIQHFGQVTLQSRLELNRPDGSRASDVEHMHKTCLHAGPGNNTSHVERDILHMPVPVGRNDNLLLIHHSSVPFGLSKYQNRIFIRTNSARIVHRQRIRFRPESNRPAGSSDPRQRDPSSYGILPQTTNVPAKNIFMKLPRPQAHNRECRPAEIMLMTKMPMT